MTEHIIVQESLLSDNQPAFHMGAQQASFSLILLHRILTFAAVNHFPVSDGR